MSVHAPCTAYEACTGRAQYVKGAQTPGYICFRNQLDKCSYFGVFRKRSETILKKNIFSSKRPPFGFSAICPIVFWPIPGVNFKLETSSCYKSSSFCEMRRHASALIDIQKFCFTLSLQHFDSFFEK